MKTNTGLVFFIIAKEGNIVKRALIVGVILNLINQWESLIHLDFTHINMLKFSLTFMVPYMVSTYSSVMSKLTFQTGEISSIDAILKCKKCGKTIININKGDAVPECKNCKLKTKWAMIEQKYFRRHLYKLER